MSRLRNSDALLHCIALHCIAHAIRENRFDMGVVHLKLGDVRAMFRLIGEVRELGGDPNRWRPHMLKSLRKQLGAEIVVSSEIHFRQSPNAKPGIMRVHDLGWGCSGPDETWQIRTMVDEKPEIFRVFCVGDTSAATSGDRVAVKPLSKLSGGTRFILSQRSLPHLGTVDQLGIHRTHDVQPFTPEHHRLVHLFHAELARLWNKDALDKARSPDADLPPRLAQTLEALQGGCSEKEVSVRLGISRHTVHNYVKALHQRLGVSSRGELLSKAPRAGGFTPKMGLDSSAE